MIRALPDASVVRRLPIAALLAVLALPALPAAADPPTGIHVTGVGEVQVVPDMARVSLEVRREGEDAAALKAELDEVTAAVIELTEELDMERRDVTAAGVSIYPRYQRVDDEQVPSGVIATRNIEVTLRDLERIGDLINGALQRGVNGVGGVALDASNRTELERQALDLAIDDAKREAEQVAGRFGVTLGRLVDAVSGYHQPQPLHMAAFSESRVAKDSFEPGEMTIRREVQATFAVR
jgi:uncharacterized protein YggE